MNTPGCLRPTANLPVGVRRTIRAAYREEWGQSRGRLEPAESCRLVFKRRGAVGWGSGGCHETGSEPTGHLLTGPSAGM